MPRSRAAIDGTRTARRFAAASTAAALLVLLAVRAPGQEAGFDRPGQLFNGRAVVDSEARPTGVALGGLGTGCFDLCTDGSFRHVSIGPVYPAVAVLPGSFLELSASAAEAPAQRRALVLGGAGGLTGIGRLRYRGIFPRAFLEASDPQLAVRATIEAWSPFVPHDVQASSLPAVAFDVVLENTSASAASATIALEWPADPALPTPVSLDAAAGEGGRVERAPGRVAASFELDPGAEGHATLVVAWDAPLHRSRARFAGAADVARALLERHDELHAATRAWQAQLFDSDLPGWYAERLCNDLAPLVTSTRLPADGPFAIAESAVGLGGILGTLDQRLIAHVAVQAFFPELDREELAHFAARQRPDGELPHHIGSLDGRAGEDEGFLGWPDLAASFVCQVWQHGRWTGDRGFAEAMAAPASSALHWLLARDADGDGIPDGGSTFDYRPPAAGFVYTASVCAAAFEAGRRLAEERGDGALASACAAGGERARAALVGRLWNGRWFARSLDASGDEASSECFLGQLAGEWYAGAMGWPSLVPAALRDRALESLVALNGAASPFIPPLDVRADGSPATTRWGWLPQTCAWYAAPLIDAGRTDAALDCLRRLDSMLVTRADDPWNVGLYYDCDTGLDPKPDYGWYMSTPASWWTLLALAGTAFDVPAGELRLAPRPPSAQRRFSVPVMLPALTARLSAEELEFGIGTRLQLDVAGVHVAPPPFVRRLVLRPPQVAEPSTLRVEVALDGEPVAGATSLREGQLVFELQQPAALAAGSSLTVAISQPGATELGSDLAARRAEGTAVLENAALRVELERDGAGLRRLRLVDRLQGGEARFDVVDLFRVALPVAGGGALELSLDPARTRAVRVLSARHQLDSDDGDARWTLEQELVVQRPGEAEQPVSVRVEVRLPPGRAAVLLSLALRGAVLGDAQAPLGPVLFPRLELLDPGRVGEPLVLRAGTTVFADAARQAEWSSEWSPGATTEPLAIAGPVPTLLVRWVDAEGGFHRLAARGDGGRHLQLEPAFRPAAPRDGWWTSSGALEIALPEPPASR